MTVFNAGHGWTTRNMQWRRLIVRTLVYAILLLGVTLTGAPFIYMITGSFRLNSEIYRYPLSFVPSDPTMINYQRLLGGGKLPLFAKLVTV